MSSQVTTRIVLASDDTITREGLGSLFRQAPGVEIIGEAESLTAASNKVRELLPDVVLIEISVPGRADGLRAATDIAQQSSNARVLVLTNNSDLTYVRSMLALGVSGYLLKSSGASQLFNAVQTVRLGGRFIDPTLGNDLVWQAIDRDINKARPVFSRRESQVFSALIRGYTNAQSADVLRLSVKSVETYRLRIYRKLNLNTRAELVEYALANRLLAEK
jgi:two-component system, NarL family, response regulator NreC